MSEDFYITSLENDIEELLRLRPIDGGVRPLGSVEGEMTTKEQPWVLEVRQDYSWRDGPTKKDGPYRVCITPIDVDTDGGKDVYVESLRDARLIAAAPKMLEVLRVLLTAAEHSPGEDIERDEIVSEGRALLARIDGAE